MSPVQEHSHRGGKFIAIAICAAIIIGIALYFLRAGTTCCQPRFDDAQLEALMKSANSGDVSAMWLLVDEGDARGDVSMTLQYLQRIVAVKEDREAMNFYYSVVYNNRIVDKMPRAREYLERSAKLNFNSAQFELASCYKDGRNGFRRDQAASIYWYKRAVSNGVAPAARYLCELGEVEYCDQKSGMNPKLRM